MDIVVQPAVSWMGLNESIKKSGLFFPVDPGPSVCHFPGNAKTIEQRLTNDRRKSEVW